MHTYIITCVGQNCVRDFVIRLVEIFKRDYVVYMFFFYEIILFINQALFTVYTTRVFISTQLLEFYTDFYQDI